MKVEHQMKLLPSLKQKKRYVVFEIIAEKGFSFSVVVGAVEKCLKDFFGEMGISKAAPMILKEKFNEEKKRFIIKVNNKYVDELISALILCKKIKNYPVILKSVVVSGTLKKANTYL